MCKPLTTRTRQGGLTAWGFLLYVLVFGGALILVLRIAPSYLEYLTVKDIVERSVDEFDPQTQSTAEVRTRIRKLLQTSQVYVIDAGDIEIYRERNKIVIDANYEVRFPLFWIVDGVMNFEDLIFKVDGN
ncbi:possible transmembrane protein [marine gamma proteobacterium HTCC2080]|jgi:hypothetical protein|nr:possible transmembrane protein [marine gamma proteobacterium HTCC2080]